MQITIINAHWTTHRNALSGIRTTVFMEEQGVSAAEEWDGKDETATHFLVMDMQSKPIACARLLDEANTSNAFHIGRVAVLKPYRQQQIGRTLMLAILKHCQQTKPHQGIYLHAQTDKQAFYEHLHFVAKGDVFIDAGIPHIEMWYRT